MLNKKVNWSQLKSFVDSRSLNVQFLEFDNSYWINAIDGQFSLTCELDKSPSDTTDLDDFEANYKAIGNTVIEPTDTDGAKLNRTKITRSGWHYQCHGIEFTSSLLSSLHNTDVADTDLGFGTIKFYNSSDAELTTQVDIDNNCVKTVIDWEAQYDIDVIGGLIFQEAPPTSNVRIWVTAAPDIPVASGGSVPFCQGGVNAKLMGSGQIYDIDGKTAKTMPYTPGFGTNKFRVTMRHNAGYRHEMMLVIKLYRENA